MEGWDQQLHARSKFWRAGITGNIFDVGNFLCVGCCRVTKIKNFALLFMLRVWGLTIFWAMPIKLRTGSAAFKTEKWMKNIPLPCCVCLSLLKKNAQKTLKGNLTWRRECDTITRRVRLTTRGNWSLTILTGGGHTMSGGWRQYFEAEKLKGCHGLLTCYRSWQYNENSFTLRHWWKVIKNYKI